MRIKEIEKKRTGNFRNSFDQEYKKNISPKQDKSYS